MLLHAIFFVFGEKVFKRPLKNFNDKTHLPEERFNEKIKEKQTIADKKFRRQFIFSGEFMVKTIPCSVMVDRNFKRLGN